MNLTLDTHALLWWLDDSPALSQGARTAIMDDRNIVIVSAAVVWEIRIKQALGKLDIDSSFLEIIRSQGFELLSITADHAYAVGDLPMHHRDPFDRMIIAQARLEGLTVVTRDPLFTKYEVPVIS
ncbi:MAG: type II toxin-antitoxin system VapC family toxin [Desulfobacterales bacterium]|nr:type II toxin-antitoxin system VapC family toxin [Desulfobacterales bacterium]MCF8079010.1 type II toxin-antitoxin system VapC family toxin [Desulfobacterales bacterium]